MSVSRVINGQPGVGPDARKAVTAAIRALGYTPNVAARSLVTSAELRIGVIYSNPSAAFMSDFLTGVYEEASARGAHLILLKGGPGGRPARGGGAEKPDRVRRLRRDPGPAAWRVPRRARGASQGATADGGRGRLRR
jgi:hypothetical protein